MLTAMFAKFPNLPGTDRAGSPDANDTAGHREMCGGQARDMAGHGARSLDWHSLRAKLSAERDLRGAMRGENEAMAGWIRAEGSFDPRAAEALFSHAHTDQDPDGASVRGPGYQQNDKNYERAESRLPDPKSSRPNDGSGCNVPTTGGGTASGLNIED